MLVATIEIWPFGNEGGKRVLSRVFIANTLERDARGNHLYRAELRTDGEAPSAILSSPAAFPHDRADGAEECVRRALQAIRQLELVNPPE